MSSKSLIHNLAVSFLMAVTALFLFNFYYTDMVFADDETSLDGATVTKLEEDADTALQGIKEGMQFGRPQSPENKSKMDNLDAILTLIHSRHEKGQPLSKGDSDKLKELARGAGLTLGGTTAVQGAPAPAALGEAYHLNVTKNNDSKGSYTVTQTDINGNVVHSYIIFPLPDNKWMVIWETAENMDEARQTIRFTDNSPVSLEDAIKLLIELYIKSPWAVTYTLPGAAVTPAESKIPQTVEKKPEKPQETPKETATQPVGETPKKTPQTPTPPVGKAPKTFKYTANFPTIIVKPEPPKAAKPAKPSTVGWTDASGNVYEGTKNKDGSYTGTVKNSAGVLIGTFNVGRDEIDKALFEGVRFPEYIEGHYQPTQVTETKEQKKLKKEKKESSVEKLTREEEEARLRARVKKIVREERITGKKARLTRDEEVIYKKLMEEEREIKIADQKRLEREDKEREEFEATISEEQKGLDEDFGGSLARQQLEKKKESSAEKLTREREVEEYYRSKPGNPEDYGDTEDELPMKRSEEAPATEKVTETPQSQAAPTSTLKVLIDLAKEKYPGDIVKQQIFISDELMKEKKKYEGDATTAGSGLFGQPSPEPAQPALGPNGEDFGVAVFPETYTPESGKAAVPSQLTPEPVGPGLFFPKSDVKPVVEIPKEAETSGFPQPLFEKFPYYISPINYEELNKVIPISPKPETEKEEGVSKEEEVSYIPQQKYYFEPLAAETSPGSVAVAPPLSLTPRDVGPGRLPEKGYDQLDIAARVLFGQYEAHGGGSSLEETYFLESAKEEPGSGKDVGVAVFAEPSASPRSTELIVPLSLTPEGIDPMAWFAQLLSGESPYDIPSAEILEKSPLVNEKGKVIGHVVKKVVGGKLTEQKTEYLNQSGGRVEKVVNETFYGDGQVKTRDTQEFYGNGNVGVHVTEYQLNDGKARSDGTFADGTVYFRTKKIFDESGIPQKKIAEWIGSIDKTVITEDYTGAQPKIITDELKWDGKEWKYTGTEEKPILGEGAEEEKLGKPVQEVASVEIKPENHFQIPSAAPGVPAVTAPKIDTDDQLDKAALATKGIGSLEPSYWDVGTQGQMLLGRKSLVKPAPVTPAPAVPAPSAPAPRVSTTNNINFDNFSNFDAVGSPSQGLGNTFAQDSAEGMGGMKPSGPEESHAAVSSPSPMPSAPAVAAPQPMSAPAPTSAPQTERRAGYFCEGR